MRAADGDCGEGAGGVTCRAASDCPAGPRALARPERRGLADGAVPVMGDTAGRLRDSISLLCTRGGALKRDLAVSAADAAKGAAPQSTLVCARRTKGCPGTVPGQRFWRST